MAAARVELASPGHEPIDLPLIYTTATIYVAAISSNTTHAYTYFTRILLCTNCVRALANNVDLRTYYWLLVLVSYTSRDIYTTNLLRNSLLRASQKKTSVNFPLQMISVVILLNVATQLCHWIMTIGTQ